jgi:hypothetical protein
MATGPHKLKGITGDQVLWQCTFNAAGGDGADGHGGHRIAGGQWLDEAAPVVQVCTRESGQKGGQL